jgi:hypothetical protein
VVDGRGASEVARPQGLAEVDRRDRRSCRRPPRHLAPGDRAGYLVGQGPGDQAQNGALARLTHVLGLRIDHTTGLDLVPAQGFVPYSWAGNPKIVGSLGGPLVSASAGGTAITSSWFSAAALPWMAAAH